MLCTNSTISNLPKGVAMKSSSVNTRAVMEQSGVLEGPIGNKAVKFTVNNTVANKNGIKICEKNKYKKYCVVGVQGRRLKF